MHEPTTITLRHCGKTFADGTLALQPLDLDIGAGETVVLLGPSGCGKTTTLRIIAGLEFPDAGGVVMFGDNDVTPLPIEQRGVGSLSMGRMSTVAYDFTIGHDFMGFAPQYSWVTSTASVPSSAFTSRISNAVRYLGKFGAFKLGANVGLGEVSGSLNANTSRGFSLGYDDGPVSAQLSLDDGRSGATDTAHASTSNRSWIASGTYDFGSAKLFAGVRDTTRHPVGTLSASNAKFHSTLYWLGVSAPLSERLTGFGGVYYENKLGTESDPMLLAAKLHYNLSKRTWLYATAGVARAKSDNGQTTLTGVYRDQTPLSGHQSGIGLGIQHRF